MTPAERLLQSGKWRRRSEARLWSSPEAILLAVDNLLLVLGFLGPPEPDRRLTTTDSAIHYKRYPTGNVAAEQSLGPRYRAGLLDVTGRKVLVLHSGENDVSHLAPGVDFACGTHRTRKTVIQH